MNNMIKKHLFFALTHISLISLLGAGCSTLPGKSYKELETFQDKLSSGGFGPVLIVVPAGQFTMGTSSDNDAVFSSEQPKHQVFIHKSFAIAKFELTFREYDIFVKSTGYEKPSDLGWGTKHWGRGKTPVFNVSWDDAQKYLAWLSSQTGASYRLPTEAEWEYGARAGTATPFHTGACINAEQANFHDKEQYKKCEPTGTYRGKVIETGSFPPNAWGIHDMHGNVWEWIQDCWHDNYENAPANGFAWLDEDNGNCKRRVLRGGSWSGRATELRSAARTGNLSDQKSIFIGFRVVRELD